MKMLVLALAMGSAAVPAATLAAETVKALQLRPKAGIATIAVAHASAPFIEPVQGPDLDLVPRRVERQEASRSSCNGESSLCYDPASGRIVYKPARQFMPAIPGLQPENISVKRDRIVLRYSF